MPTLDTLKALADETRLRILSILESGGELCACEIEAVLELNQSNASRHLGKLRAAGLVRAERHGLWVHYQLEHTSAHFATAVRAIEAVRKESGRFGADLARLSDYRASRYTCETIGEWSCSVQ